MFPGAGIQREREYTMVLNYNLFVIRAQPKHPLHFLFVLLSNKSNNFILSTFAYSIYLVSN